MSEKKPTLSQEVASIKFREELAHTAILALQEQVMDLKHALKEALARVEKLESASARKSQAVIGQAVGKPYCRGGVWYQKFVSGYNQTTERRIEAPTA